MEKTKKTTGQETKASDNITISLPNLSRFNLSKLNLSATLLILFVFAAGLLIGSLYTKVQYLEKTGSPTTPSVAGVNTTDTTGTNPAAPTTAPQFVDVKVGALPVLGEKDAPVTIVEFSDFQCPFCRTFFEDTYAQLKTDYIDTGKVQLSYRHLPLDFHPAAQISAEAAECANDQGKFWEYHDLLYQKQAEKGTGTIEYTKDDIKTWMSELGIDAETFNQCVDGGTHTQAVKDDATYAATVGVQATPSFFVNGQKVEGAQPFAVFKTLIDQELAKAK